MPSIGHASTPLDSIDRRILTFLQQDSTISNLDLAGKVALSPPACLKRVRRLREAGYIERTVSLLSAERMGYPLLTIIRVKLALPVVEAAKTLEATIAANPRVIQSMMVAGDFDYVLIVRSRDVGHYQDFARNVLATAGGIQSYASEIVLSVNKSTTEIPIDI